MSSAHDRVDGEPVVLIVDDHPDTVDLITEYLRFHGAQPLRADTVEEARSVLESNVHVDVVVTDYAMPSEDGLSLLATIRATPKWKALPVVMLSGHDTGGEIASAARRLGADFVRKPFDLDELVAITSTRASVQRRVRRDQRGTDPAPPAARPPAATPSRAKRRSPLRDLIEVPAAKRDPRAEPDD